MTKETEQLDELSRKTLNSYKTAATKDKNASEKEAVGKYPYEPGSEGDKESDKLYDRADKRRAGMSAARKRLKGYYNPKKTKYHAEETEQLDECGCKMKMAIKKKMEEKRDI
jgi:hypothetical protein